MRTSSLPLEGGPTSTPTGRISKAKKGKRVHACSYEAAERAEHKRRHELNHNPDAMFHCNRPGCRKAFHRLDLLQRHQERHELEHQLESQTAQSHHINPLPSQNEMPSSMPPSSLASPQPGAAGRASAGMSIGSLVHPSSQGYDRMGTPALYPSFNRPAVPFVNGFSTSDDSTFWTPESSQSPVSDQYGRHHPHRGSISSSSSVAYDTVQTSPMVNGANIWVPSSAPPNILPNNMFDDQTYMTSLQYPYPSQTWMETSSNTYDENYPMLLGSYPQVQEVTYQVV
ncbi:uncharacterized protein AB675_8642 [Cyphellophora attinorum]|uniref:C2H2-type domain-containing protein n=1 Tax=Cyphellophora attinorum TaxID=1664694 RepID=A0A0N1P176_9EURO|nr:uncharacterized protein AB675_8642 [Phialophora attinorum]KPI44373.1 hypothetical protein AB675_8642 [Phialophora attinorum]